MQSRSILLAVTASFFFASSTFLSKLLGSGVWGDALHPLQVTHSRFAFGLVTAVILFLALRRRFTQTSLQNTCPALDLRMGWCCCPFHRRALHSCIRCCGAHIP